MIVGTGCPLGRRPLVGMRELAPSGQTVRIVVRIRIGGSRVRVSNAYGAGDLRVSAASLGRRAEGASVVEGTHRRLTFDGATTSTIRAGAVAISDPANLHVEPLMDVVVSLHLPAMCRSSTNHRWPDKPARRLVQRARALAPAVVNLGIGGGGMPAP